MSEEKIKKEHIFLKFLFNTTENQQKLLMSNLTKSQINVIIEVVYNALKGNLIISEHDKRRLKRYRCIIRNIVSKGLSLKKKKNFNSNIL